MDGKAEKISEIAKKLVGIPYKYGAKAEEAPDCFDCSSFTQYLYAQAGMKIPRSTIEQAELGRKVLNKKNLKPADLVFIKGERGHFNKKFPGGIGHVAIFVGDGKVVHAASKRTSHWPEIIETGKVVIEPAGKILNRKDLVVIKRILK